MNPPYFYDYANAWQTVRAPCAVQPKDNATFYYYFRYLLKRCISLFVWNVPETWDKDYFLYTLYMFGFVGIVDTNEFGVIPQYCTLSGYDVFYRPRKILVANPAFNASEKREYDLRGDTPDAALIKLQPDYSGVMDICGIYASKLAYAHEALYTNFINSKLAYVFLTDNKAAAETFKKIFDQIQRGDPAVVAGNKLKSPTDDKPLWELFNNNLKQNFIATDLLDNMRSIMNDFDSFIGIPSANVEKRERLVTDEVNANNVETETLIDLMDRTIHDGLEHCNDLFGLNVTCSRKFKTGGKTENEVDTSDRL